jgi:hypothetical protein
MNLIMRRKGGGERTEVQYMDHTVLRKEYESNHEKKVRR